MKLMNTKTMLAAAALLLMSADVFSASGADSFGSGNPFDYGERSSIPSENQWRNKEEFEAEYKKLTRKYKKGNDAEAALRLGIIWQAGGRVGDSERVATNPEKAIKWFKNAAKLGNQIAMFNLGTLYSLREDPKDHIEAVQWYEKSAEQGFAPAQYDLGSCYANGKDIWDNPKAILWLVRAAKQKHKEAVKVLSTFDPGYLFRIGIYAQYGIQGLPVDELLAVELFQYAAKKGHKVAQAKLERLERLGIVPAIELLD